MSLYIRYLRFLGVSVAGKPLYICSDLKIDGSDYGLIRIGRDVVISSEVRLLTHDYTIEKALKFSGKNLDSEVRRLSGISFGNDVFIGMRSTVLPGVSIGNRSIVGACSVVNKNIPPDQVWGGNPAKYICSMSDFSDRTLLKIRENPDEYLKE